MAQGLVARWMDVPTLASPDPAVVRMHRVMLVVGPVSFLMHAIIGLGVFPLLGAWPLVWPSQSDTLRMSPVARSVLSAHV